MLKSFFFYVLIFLSLWLSSCKERELVLFGMDYETNINIPPTFGVDLPTDFYSPHIITNSQSVFKKEDTSRELIESVQLKNFVVYTDEAQSAIGIESIAAYIRNDQGETKIAETSEIDNTKSTIHFLLSRNQNVKSYLMNDTFSIRLSIITKDTTNTSLNLRVEMQFDIVAIKK